MDELRELFESKLLLITEKAGLPKYAIGNYLIVLRMATARKI